MLDPSETKPYGKPVLQSNWMKPEPELNVTTKLVFLADDIAPGGGAEDASPEGFAKKSSPKEF